MFGQEKHLSPGTLVDFDIGLAEGYVVFEKVPVFFSVEQSAVIKVMRLNTKLLTFFTVAILEVEHLTLSDGAEQEDLRAQVWGSAFAFCEKLLEERSVKVRDVARANAADYVYFGGAVGMFG